MYDTILHLTCSRCYYFFSFYIIPAPPTGVASGPTRQQQGMYCTAVLVLYDGSTCGSRVTQRATLSASSSTWFRPIRSHSETLSRRFFFFFCVCVFVDFMFCTILQRIPGITPGKSTKDLQKMKTRSCSHRRSRTYLRCVQQYVSA